MAMQTAVYISSPYFTPFMLRHLNLSYLQYMFLISLGFAGKSIGSAWAAQFARRIGADRLLWIGGLGIIPLAGMWLVSQQIWYFALVQVLGGGLWACYELSMLLLFFERIPKSQRVEVLSIYNVGNSVAMLIGSLLGAAILYLFQANGHAYLMVFLASSLARGGTLLILPRSNQQTHLFGEVASRIIAVRPGMGFIQRPIVSTIEMETSPLEKRSVEIRPLEPVLTTKA